MKIDGLDLYLGVKELQMELYDTPYYAVVFTSKHSDDISGYSKMAGRMEELASQQPGYLGFESARSEVGIAVSYWRDLDSIKNWKANLKHQAAQRLGKDKWYSNYTVRICKVEREYRLGLS